MTSRDMSDSASIRALSRRDMTYRAAGAGEQLIHSLLERLHDRRRSFLLQLQHGLQRQRLITAQDPYWAQCSLRSAAANR